MVMEANPLVIFARPQRENLACYASTTGLSDKK